MEGADRRDVAGRADKTRRPGERAAVQGDRPTRGDLIMEMRAVASGAAVEFDREKAAGEQGKRTNVLDSGGSYPG